MLGIDPGFGRIGWGVVVRVGSKVEPGAYGLIETPKTDILTRLALIEEAVTGIIEREKPDALATERLLFAANRTTALDVSKALGVILLCAHRAGLPWSEFSPPEVKLSVTGTGAADKAQVNFMVCRLLGLAKPPRPDDVADALGIALTLALRTVGNGVPSPGRRQS